MTKPKNLEFRPCIVYAEKEIYQEKLKNGFAEVAFSNEGSWSFYKRISKLCAFYHPDGRIETYEHPEYCDVGCIRVGKPVGSEYKDENSLQGVLKNFKLKLGKKRKIIDILNDSREFR